MGPLRHLFRAAPNDKRLGRIPHLRLEHRPDRGGVRGRGDAVPGERILSRLVGATMASHVAALSGLPLTGPARTW
jgi:hypothetical protein